MAGRVTRALGSRGALAIVVVAVMALASSSIAIGFLTDDHGFRAALRSTSARAPAAYDLFRFIPGEIEENQLRVRYGAQPWWAAPDLKIHFLRPITSLVFAADDRLFGDAPLGYHLSSLAWYLALLVAAGALFRRVLPAAAATIALAVFGASAAHVEGYAWISARHAVIAGALGAAALVARWSRRRWLAPVVFAVALASSEAALAVAPLWIALELGGGARPWRARVRACAPVVVLSVLYLIGYAALGGGTRGSGGYHDPMADPVGFAALAAIRVPLLLGDAALGIPAELAHVIAEWKLCLLGIAAVGVVGLAWWLTAPVRRTRPLETGSDAVASEHLPGVVRPGTQRGAGEEGPQVSGGLVARGTQGGGDDERMREARGIAAASGSHGAWEVESQAGVATAGGSRAEPAGTGAREVGEGALGWFVAGGIAATVLGAAGYPSGRVLVIPDLAFAALLGWVLERGISARWPGKILAGALAAVHLVAAPFAVVRAIARDEDRARATEAIAARIVALAPPLGRVVIVAASDPLVFVYPRGVLADVAPGTVRCWSVWSAARASHRVTRTASHTLEIEPIGRTLLDGSFDELYRSADRPFEVGATVEQCGATIRVAAVRDGRPARLEVTLRRSLDSPEVMLMVWRDRQLVRFAPPRIGETVELPWSAGPAGAL